MYSEIEPYDTGYLDVGGGHALYYEQCGNPDGIPAVFLHGGPGAGIHPDMRRLYNPEKFRIILFDQRGAGKSKPSACLENNAIADNVADVERMRTHLGVEKWVVSGGSWGSSLSLFYAIEHSERVMRLIVTGIFFADKKGSEWLAEEGGASELMPEWFAPYRDYISPEKRANGLIAAYDDLLASGTEDEVLQAAKVFNVYDTAMLTFEIPYARIKEVEDKPQDFVALTKTFFHFARHYYTEENRIKILDGVKALGDIPCAIIHGRYDFICPVSAAYELHQAYPQSELFVLDKTGHTTREPNMMTKFIEISDSIAEDANE